MTDTYYGYISNEQEISNHAFPTFILYWVVIKTGDITLAQRWSLTKDGFSLWYHCDTATFFVYEHTADWWQTLPPSLQFGIELRCAQPYHVMTDLVIDT